MAAIVCWQSEADCAESNRSRMCEIRLAKLSCAAQQVGIVHFYAVTEIKGLSCRLWWMREWRNLLTPTHVGYRSVIRAVASGTSLKFGVQGASATNWFSRVNGARDNGIRLYCTVTNADKLEPFQTARFMGPTWGPPGSCRPQMGPMLAQWTLLPGFLMFLYQSCLFTSTSHLRPLWKMVLRQIPLYPNPRDRVSSLTWSQNK